MDVHRCRFVPYPASEINALAFSHQSAPKNRSPEQLRLAVGRANGDIEIWNPLGGLWAQEIVLRGGKDRTTDGLVWTQDTDWEAPDGKRMPGKLRLFSIGHSPVVTEWDLATGRPARQSNSTYGDVWCMAAQPRAAGRTSKKQPGQLEESKHDQLIAAGCADGSIVLLDTSGGELTYLKTIPIYTGKKSRVVCLAWDGRDKIVAGYSSSEIRVFDIKGKGRQVASMSLGAERGKSADTHVWSIKILNDGTYVSADSTGEIKFWDSKLHTLSQRVKGHLDADALSLAVSADGSTIFSGGMDRRTVVYRRSTADVGGRAGRWAPAYHRRFHRSDVKDMAAYESRDLSVIVSGSGDATAVIMPLETFGQENYRAITSITSAPVIDSAPKARLIMSWWGQEIRIWRISQRRGQRDLQDGNSDDDKSDGGDDERTAKKLVAAIVVQGDESITCATINEDGSLVAVCTSAATKLFHLRPSTKTSMLRVGRIDLPSSAATGAKLTSLSPDGKWLASSLADNSVRLLRITPVSDAKQPYRVEPSNATFGRNHGRSKTKVEWGTHGDYDHVISRFAWSHDSRILVAGDLSGTFDTWILSDEQVAKSSDQVHINGTSKKRSQMASDDETSDDESEDDDHTQIILGQCWKKNPLQMPLLQAAPVAMAFRPPPGTAKPLVNGNADLHSSEHISTKNSRHVPSNGEDRIIVVNAKHEIFEYNGLTGRLTEWSRRNTSATLPVAFGNVLDRTMDCFWDTGNGKQRVFLYGSTWFWMFDVSRDMPGPSTLNLEGQSRPLDSLDADQSRKRKREQIDLRAREAIKKNVGAGGKVVDRERIFAEGGKLSIQSGTQGQVLETTYKYKSSKPPHLLRGDEADGEFDDHGDSEIEDEESDEEEEADQELTLIRLRRKNDRHGTPQRNGGEVGKSETDPPHDWKTFKYRSILGIVPLAQHEVEGQQGESIDSLPSESREADLEVAIVERPLWDADLGPRWEGPQEWGER